MPPSDSRSRDQFGIIIQARMGSTRLPGKVLRIVQDKPVLEYLLERSIQANMGKVVLVTSTLAMDDAIESLCNKMGITCLRGDPLNVASRYKMVLATDPFDFFVRICGDSPLLDFSLVNQAVERFKKGKFDLVTNTHPRSFPKGQSVEVVGRDVFLRAYSKFTDVEDFEHVTHFFYRTDSEFSIDNFSCSSDYKDMQLSIDTPQDLIDFEKTIHQMERPQWQYSYQELVGMRIKASKQNQNSV